MIDVDNMRITKITFYGYTRGIKQQSTYSWPAGVDFDEAEKLSEAFEKAFEGPYSLDMSVTEEPL